MKTLSVSVLKQTWKSVSRAYPKEGTYRAEVLNKLKRLPGAWVYLEKTNCLPGTLTVIKDEYGCDIENNPKVAHEYRIVGEWFGRDYVSYIDEVD